MFALIILSIFAACCAASRPLERHSFLEIVRHLSARMSTSRPLNWLLQLVLRSQRLAALISVAARQALDLSNLTQMDETAWLGPAPCYWAARKQAPPSPIGAVPECRRLGSGCDDAIFLRPINQTHRRWPLGSARNDMNYPAARSARKTH